MFKLDIDEYQLKALIGTNNKRGLLQLLFSIPLPYEIRRSSSYEGLHIRTDKLPDRCYLRDIYDDQVRLKLDDYRFHILGWDFPLSNRQWDRKGDNEAEEWTVFKDQVQIIDFVNSITVDVI